MPKKCCVPHCKSNYDSAKRYVPVFSLPFDLTERKLWLMALALKIEVFIK